MSDQEQVVEIKVDIDALTFGDVEYILSWGDDMDNIELRTLIPFMQRVVVGGVKHLKFRSDFIKVMAAIAASLNSAADPQADGQGN